MQFSLGCILKAIMRCLSNSLAHNTIACSGHSHQQQRGPKSLKSDGIHIFCTCGIFFPMAFCKLQANNTQGKLNGHLQNYFATLGFLVMLRLATDLKSRLVTAWGNTNGKNVVFFRHPRWLSLFLNQQSVQNIVFWCLICLNARVKLNVNILGVWSKVKFRYRTRNTYYRPHIYSYISHWVVCQVLTNRYLM